MKITKIFATAVLAAGLLCATTASPANAATCSEPAQVPGVLLKTGSGTVFESGVWVFQVNPLKEGSDPTHTLCADFEVGRVQHTPGTGSVLMRLAIKPAGGSSYNDYTPWTVIPNNGATWTKVYTSMPVDDYFKVEAQSQLTTGAAAYCSTGTTCG